jgi:hypothetical protein
LGDLIKEMWAKEALIKQLVELERELKVRGHDFKWELALQKSKQRQAGEKRKADEMEAEPEPEAEASSGTIGTIIVKVPAKKRAT